jgi:protein TonB
MEGRVVTKVAPVYPPLARQARIQGTVILKVRINKSGDVETMQLFSGHPMLAPAAIEAVKQWKYKPSLLNGGPVNVETQVRVNFKLAGNGPGEGVVGDAPGGTPPDQRGGIISRTPVCLDASARQSVRLSQGVIESAQIKKVPPRYPPEAKDQRIQGVVVMQVIINEDGNVSNIQLVSGHPVLAPAAIEAVKQWKYKPYKLNGAPVEIETQIEVNFTLPQ